MPSSNNSPQESPLDDDNLGSEHLAVVSVLGGSNKALDMLRAHVMESEGEQRPQQEAMLSAVESAIQRNRALLVQAGTGTGKSLAYAFAAAASGKRTVIATATNQLSEQLTKKDLPQVAELMRKQKRPLAVASLKGRGQYVCKARLQETKNLGEGAGQSDTLFGEVSDDEIPAEEREGRAFSRLVAWAETTDTGERSDAPVVTERLWRQLSVSAAECARSDCPFYTECFAEKARNAARKADIIITNHALLAQETKLAQVSDSADAQQGALLPQHEVLIIDEAHAFPSVLSDALSVTVDTDAIHKHVKKARRVLDITDTAHSSMLTKCADALDSVQANLHLLPPGPAPALPQELRHALETAIVQLLSLAKSLKDTGVNLVREGKQRRGTAAVLLGNQIDDDAVSLSRCRTTPDGSVRWVESGQGDRAPLLSVAPLDVGPVFASTIEGRTVVGTSATLTVAGEFDIIKRSLGVSGCDELDVGTPFSYPAQGMLYIPKPPFPEPVGKDRFEHTAAVLTEVEALVEAAGGRTLALFTTTQAAINAAAHLRKIFPGLNILSHGEAPAEALVRDFTDDETSVLCATMGMWQGVSVEGASCSLVIIDKVSFPPPDDALTQARREFVEESGRDGFNEVFVAKAAIDIAQASGRLIRTSTDKGVVAVLDPRLLSKRYGRILINSMPEFPLFTDRNTVTAALARLTGGLPSGAKKKIRAKPKSVAGKRSATRRPSVNKVTRKRRIPRDT